MELFCITATFTDGTQRRKYAVSRFAASQRHAEVEDLEGVVRVTTEPFNVPTKSYPDMVAFLNKLESDSEPARVEASTLTTLEKQVGGEHYKKHGEYQPWKVLKAWLTPEEFRGYMKGQAIAYLARERDKGGDVDVAKAEHYLNGLLALQE